MNGRTWICGERIVEGVLLLMIIEIGYCYLRKETIDVNCSIPNTDEPLVLRTFLRLGKISVAVG